MKRILVVEDDVAIRRLAQDVLADEGFEVVTAETGEDGLRALEEHRPDAIVLDLMMPTMDGRTFRARMSDDFGATPILVLSGSRDIHEAAQQLGAAGALLKPFDLDDLVEAVRRMLPGS